MPVYQKSFESLLDKLLQEWWPKDDAGALIKPGELNGEALIAFRNKVDEVTNLLPLDWLTLGSWLMDQSQIWQTWNDNPPPYDARDWETIKMEARDEIVRGDKKDPLNKGELPIFDRLANLKK